MSRKTGKPEQEDEAEESVGWHVGGLVFFGGLSVYINAWHAIHSGKAHAAGAAAALPYSSAMGVLFGIVPPLIAAYLSHDVAKAKRTGGWAYVVWAVCAMGMLLSINAQAQTARPYVGEGICYAFPVMIDLATFYSLSRLMAAAKARARRVKREADERAQARAEEVAERRARIEAERTQAQAQADEERARIEKEERAQARQERAQTREARRAQAEEERAQARPEGGAKEGARTGPGIKQPEWEARIRDALDVDPGLTLTPASVGAALDVDRQIRSSGVFKRAVAAVRAEQPTNGTERRLQENPAPLLRAVGSD